MDINVSPSDSFTKEHSPEVVNHSLDFKTVLFEHVFNDSSVAKARCIGELYRRGCLSLHIHFTCPGHLDSHDFCALYRRLPFGIRRDTAVSLPVGGNLPRMKTEFLGYYNQQPVFVDIVELREFPEGAVLGIGSLVRLQLLNLCESGTAYERSHLVAYDIVKNLLPNVDGKGGFASGIRASALQDGELIDKMVEGRSEVVDAIPDNQGQFGIEWAGTGMFEGGSLKLPYSIHFDFRGNDFALSVQSGHAAGVQIKEVKLCSADLCTDAN
jgi:hypothetical protein